MEKSTTEAGVVPAAIVEEAWQQVGASFERFCLTAGIATLAGMMETDAARLCGTRYGRDDGKHGYRWGRAKGKLGFHGGKIEVERPRVRARAPAARLRCRAGKQRWPRIGWVSGL
jgi:putative transposase